MRGRIRLPLVGALILFSLTDWFWFAFHYNLALFCGLTRLCPAPDYEIAALSHQPIGEPILRSRPTALALARRLEEEGDYEDRDAVLLRSYAESLFKVEDLPVMKNWYLSGTLELILADLHLRAGNRRTARQFLKQASRNLVDVTDVWILLHQMGEEVFLPTSQLRVWRTDLAADMVSYFQERGDRKAAAQYLGAAGPTDPALSPYRVNPDRLSFFNSELVYSYSVAPNDPDYPETNSPSRLIAPGSVVWFSGSGPVRIKFRFPSRQIRQVSLSFLNYEDGYDYPAVTVNYGQESYISPPGRMVNLPGSSRPVLEFDLQFEVTHKPVWLDEVLISGSPST